MIVFDKKWFEKYQNTLLWLLNKPIISIWFRWIMRIDKNSHHNAKIVNISTNNFTIINKFLENGISEYTTDFRTHDKYSKRLYLAFKPFWYLLHMIDWVAFDRYERLSRLSFGFSTLTAYPASSGNPTSGFVVRSVTNESWATIRAGAGTFGGEYTPGTDPDADKNVIIIISGTSTNFWAEICRAIYCFDTSALTSDAIISTAVLSLYGTQKLDTFSTPIAPNLDIYTSTPASTTALVDADYSQFGSISQTGSPISYASWNTSGYNDFTFNSTGIGNISLTGISKFGARNANYDVSGTTPVWKNSQVALLRARYPSGSTSTDPKLVVTYTIPSVNSNFFSFF